MDTLDISVLNDMHIFSTHALMGLEDFRTLVRFQDPATTYLNGDIIDIANADQAELNKAIAMRGHLKDHFGSHYHDGNHELGGNFDASIVKVGQSRFLIKHGDDEWWGREKALRYRRKKPGASKFKRNWLEFYDEFRKLAPMRITSEFEKNIKALGLLMPFNTYICGHKHPEKVWQAFVGHKSIIVLPRGLTRLRLFGDGSIEVLAYQLKGGR